MIKEDFNRVKASSTTQSRPNCSNLQKEPPLCDRGKCETIILCQQANVSKCESELFCNAVNRLNCELYMAQTPCELKQVFELINSLLTSSAAKELSLAEIIKASSVAKRKDQDCDC